MGTAVILAVAAFTVAPRLDPADPPAFALSLVPLAAVLLQGVAYWWLARRWAVTGGISPRTAAAYRAFRVLDPVLWIACLLGVVLPAPLAGAAVLSGIAGACSPGASPWGASRFEHVRLVPMQGVAFDDWRAVVEEARQRFTR